MTDSTVSQFEDLYGHIWRTLGPSDPHLVPRVAVPEALRSDVLLIGQALGRDTQRLSGFPYCFPGEPPRLSKGGRVLDAFLGSFGYTIDPAATDRRQAYHSDVAHHFTARRERGGDVQPSNEEIERSRLWLEREIQLVSPTVVITLGKLASLVIVSAYGGVIAKRLGDVLGRRYDLELAGCPVAVFPTYHPSGAWQFRDAQRVYDSVANQVGKLLMAKEWKPSER